MSYRKKHVKHKIGKIKQKKSVFTRIWFWLAILFLIIIFSVFYFTIFYSGFQIKNIIISGNNRVKTQDIKNIVSENINAKLVKFSSINITSKSIFLVNQNNLDKEILKSFLTIDDVKISKAFPQTLILDVSERKPIGAYCNNPGQCFLIDNSGIVFEPVSATDNMTIVRQISDNGQIVSGQKVLAQNIANTISDIQKSLKNNFQIDLQEALITSPVRLNVKTNENWQIYFDLDSGANIDSQLAKLNRLLNGEISIDTRKNLRYIDLRPKDRAIICANKTCGN